MDDLNHLAKLYEEDPLKYTDENIAYIISEQRKAFGAFQAGVKTAGTSKTKAQQDPAKAAAAKALLESLGLST